MDEAVGFNGAAVFQPRKWRRPGARGSQAVASMGPRSFNRGNDRTSLRGIAGYAASMGPRSFNRGNRTRTGPGDGKCGFNGAAVFQPRKSHWQRPVIAMVTMLQWGRGLSTAEMCLGAASGMRWSCFNGAAVFQPRKSSTCSYDRAAHASLQWGRGLSTAEIDRAESARQHRGWLQWGRGLSTAEIIGRRQVCAAEESASMGPRSFNRGNVPTADAVES